MQTNSLISSVTRTARRLAKTFLMCGVAIFSLQTLAQGVAVTGSVYVQANNPTTNYSSNANILLKNNSTNNINVRLGYLKFDLSAATTDFPSNFGLNMAVIGNNQGATPSPPQSFAGATTNDPGTFVIQVWGLNGNTAWNESTVTWNNAPGSPGLINSASQARYGFNEAQSSLLATCSIAANTPPATFYCASADLRNFMNARKGVSDVTLMFRRTDTNSQANLALASARFAPGGATVGDYSPTFAQPNALGPSFTPGPAGAAVGNPPTVTTSVPSTAVNANQVEATLGGNVTDTGGDSPTQFVQYRLSSVSPWIKVDLGLSKGTSTSSGGVYSSVVTLLSQNTSYDVQAYATNTRGTGYGVIRTFTTASAPVSAPVVTTTTPTTTLVGNQVQATLAGSLTSNGNENPTRFVRYRLTSGGPWTDVDLMSSDATASPYSTLVTTLSASTGYDVQAYATNSAGTGFGAIVAFTTAAAAALPAAGTATSIPTLSDWGRVLLTLVIAFFGFIYLRQKPSHS